MSFFLNNKLAKENQRFRLHRVKFPIKARKAEISIPHMKDRAKGDTQSDAGIEFVHVRTLLAFIFHIFLAT